MIDFFISYTSADRKWAEWIAFILEDAGYTTAIQAWDFGPGKNFVLEMQKASASAGRTIAVLSPDYFKSRFAASEWAVAFGSDPDGRAQKLVPVRVKECQVDGLLGAIVYIDLVGVASESAARSKLLSSLVTARLKPAHPPAYPGPVAAASYPGRTRARFVRAAPVVIDSQLIRKSVWPDGHEKFARAEFKKIAEQFLELFRHVHKDRDIWKTSMSNDISFWAASTYVYGEVWTDYGSAFFRLWRGAPLGEPGISFISGDRDSSLVDLFEILRVETTAKGPTLFRAAELRENDSGEDFEVSPLTADAAAKYLWNKFFQRIPRSDARTIKSRDTVE